MTASAPAQELAQISPKRIAAQAAASRSMARDRTAALAYLVRQKIETADIQARKAYLQVVAPEIRVDDHKVQIIGDKASLAAVIAGHQTAAGRVSGFVRKWRTIRNKDYNSYTIDIEL